MALNRLRLPDSILMKSVRIFFGEMSRFKIIFLKLGMIRVLPDDGCTVETCLEN